MVPQHATARLSAKDDIGTLAQPRDAQESGPPNLPAAASTPTIRQQPGLLAPHDRLALAYRNKKHGPETSRVFGGLQCGAAMRICGRRTVIPG